MNVTKKVLAVLLSLTLLMSFAACGDSGTQSDPASAEDSVAQDSSTQVSDADVSESEESAGETESTTAKEESEITFEEMTVVDNDECAVKITSIDNDSIWGYTLNVSLENKSSDKTYMFSVDSMSVNNVEVSDLFANEVAAGKKSNEELTFTESNLEDNGVTEYTDIEITFRVYDSDDWTADNVAYETVHVYPFGEENAVEFVRESQESDVVLVDNDDVTVIVTGYDEENLWGYTANLYLVNKTDTTVMFTADDVSVNGYMADPYFANSVSAGKCAFTTMSWSDSTLEDNGITDIEEIEFTLRAYDYDDYTADDLVNESITLNP